MPGMDGTGPQGTGPWGRGRGPCGRGLGRGPGWGGWNEPWRRSGWSGRIWGRQYPGSPDQADREALEEHIRMLEGDLAAARQQLEALGGMAREKE